MGNIALKPMAGGKYESRKAGWLGNMALGQLVGMKYGSSTAGWWEIWP